jgi:hypothetical protein
LTGFATGFARFFCLILGFAFPILSVFVVGKSVAMLILYFDQKLLKIVGIFRQNQKPNAESGQIAPHHGESRTWAGQGKRDPGPPCFG